MSRVLIAWELGSGLGHLEAIRHLSILFEKRGHDIWIASREAAYARIWFQNTSVQCIQSPIPRRSKPAVFVPPFSFEQLLHNACFGELDDLKRMVSEWRVLYEQVSPEFILFEHSPVALLASRGLDVQRALTGTGFSIPTNPLPEIRNGDSHDKIGSSIAKTECLTNINAVADISGLSRLERIEELYESTNRAFMRTYRELDHFKGRETGEYLGTIESSTGIEPHWPTISGPRLFAYLKKFENGNEVVRQLIDSKSVSYTHLDVYKRQNQDCARVETPGAALRLQSNYKRP